MTRFKSLEDRHSKRSVEREATRRGQYLVFEEGIVRGDQVHEAYEVKDEDQDQWLSHQHAEDLHEPKQYPFQPKQHKSAMTPSLHEQPYRELQTPSNPGRLTRWRPDGFHVSPGFQKPFLNPEPDFASSLIFLAFQLLPPEST